MKNVREEVLQKMRQRWPEMSREEKAVASLLAKCHKPLQQWEIAMAEDSLGAHKVFERTNRSNASTLRQVRQVIHDLKVNHRIAILSNGRGYWIPNTIEEVEKYMATMKQQARSAARSYMVTYYAMQKSVSGLTQTDPTSLFTSEDFEQMYKELDINREYREENNFSDESDED